MPQERARKSIYRINDPKNFFSGMRADITLLKTNRAYVSLATVIVCCLDAIAAGSGNSSSGKFERFVGKHFPDLCRELEQICPGTRKTGAAILWDNFRNGFAHLRKPQATFAIAEDHELDGRWAGNVEVNSVGTLKAINIDRLAEEFLQVLQQCEARSKSQYL